MRLFLFDIIYLWKSKYKDATHFTCFSTVFHLLQKQCWHILNETHKLLIFKELQWTQFGFPDVCARWNWLEFCLLHWINSLLPVVKETSKVWSCLDSSKLGMNWYFVSDFGSKLSLILTKQIRWMWKAWISK